jgi:glycosyltransferase involved in cell wall biosynthesis
MPLRSTAARPPRVLYCTDTYPPQVNGVSVVTALSVCGLRARGWEVAVVGPRYPAPSSDPFGASTCLRGDADVHVGVPSIAFPPYPDIRIAAPAYASVARVVRDFEPDLVHCETEFMIGRLGQIAAMRAGIPMVTSYHTDFSRYTESYGVPWLRRPVTRYLARFHARARRTYTPSHPTRDELRALGLHDVEVWGRGVDAEMYHPQHRSTPLRTTLGVDAQFVFLHVGRLAAEKGVSVILDAFRQASALLPAQSIHLIIAGSGPEEAALRAQAPEGVSFLGFLDRTRRLPQLYASADAFLFSSLTETLGLVVLEAMASGLPVIATPAGGVADHLRDGGNGLAFAAHDGTMMAHQMVRLAMDRGLRRRLACGARLTAERLSWEAELDRLDISYRELSAPEPRMAIVPSALPATA